MMAQLTPVVKWLLITNLAIFFGDMLFFDEKIAEFGAFTTTSALAEKKWWQFITFQFIHAHMAHVLFNSIGLYFFGPWMERWWGAGKFIVFYLLCGAAGAFFYVVLVGAGILPQSILVPLEGGGLERVPMTKVPLVGASAGIYGILIGVAVIAPALRVSLLFPPVTLTMRRLALILMAISVLIIVFKIGGNEGGEAGHLGGAIMGFFLMQVWIWFSSKGGSFGKMRGPRKDIEPKIRPRTMVDLRSESEIDRLLDKISKDGFQSLTEEERDLLHQAAKSQEK
ncbi:MAG: rhomboid family intramembrane serine protease [Akkermansiaceae bacterium]|jgi:membrane associated rhomboid family serine protease|nr:rhomboid family intramembrane serine protease [Akkermansiaceae bacterium]